MHVIRFHKEFFAGLSSPVLTYPLTKPDKSFSFIKTNKTKQTTPRLQQLYSDAKEFKLKYGYQFCWARNGSIFLRYSADEGSKLLKVRTSGDLARYAQDEQGQLS